MSQSFSIKHLLKRVRDDSSVRSAFFVFVLTRALVFTIFILGTNLTIIEPNRVFGRDMQETSISLSKAPVARKLRALVWQADAGWYLDIAKNGYEEKQFAADDYHNWAFFPLYPLLWRFAAKLTGGFLLTGAALSNLFLFFALVLLHKTAYAFTGDEATAHRAVFYIATFPMSYFFSIPYSESLFLLLTVGSFYAAKRERWWLAGLTGALATATRFNGILLLPALALLYWQQHRTLKPRAQMLWLLLIPTGLLAFMFHLYRLTGNAFAFKDVLVVWGRRTGLFLRPLWEYLLNPLELSYAWDFKFLNFAAAILALACGGILFKRRQWSLALYTLLSIFVALSSQLMQGMARYMMVVFPIFIVLAMVGRSPRLDQTIRTVFIASLAILATLYAFSFTLTLG